MGGKGRPGNARILMSAPRQLFDVLVQVRSSLAVVVRVPFVL